MDLRKLEAKANKARQPGRVLAELHRLARRHGFIVSVNGDKVSLAYKHAPRFFNSTKSKRAENVVDAMDFIVKTLEAKHKAMA